MTTLFFLLLLVVVLAVAGTVVGSLATLAWWILIGLVTGGLARLLVRDTGGLGVVATVLAGVGGAVGGGLVADALELGALLQFIVALLVSAVLIALIAGSSRGD